MTLLGSAGLLRKYEYIVTELLSLELLVEEEEMPSTNNDVPSTARARGKYYRIHPLLTLFLRQTIQNEQTQSPDQSETLDYALITRAFQDYYTQHANLWASAAEASQHLHDEETNFLSAISLALAYPSPDRCFLTFPTQAFVRLAALSLIDPTSTSSITSIIEHFSLTLINRFEDLRLRRGDRKLNESPVVLAMFAAIWLCEYHASTGSSVEFKTAAEKMLALIKIAGKVSERCMITLAGYLETASVQKAFAVTDGMVDGLRIRRPFVGLVMSESESAGRMSPFVHAFGGEKSWSWSRLLMGFGRLLAIAVQVQLISE